MSDLQKKSALSQLDGASATASVLLLAIVLVAGAWPADAGAQERADLFVAGDPDGSDADSRSREPAKSDSAEKAKENVKSNPAAPEKRHKFRRSILGDFNCYDATAERLAGTHPSAHVSIG